MGTLRLDGHLLLLYLISFPTSSDGSFTRSASRPRSIRFTPLRLPKPATSQILHQVSYYCYKRKRRLPINLRPTRRTIKSYSEHLTPSVTASPTTRRDIMAG